MLSSKIINDLRQTLAPPTLLRDWCHLLRAFICKVIPRCLRFSFQTGAFLGLHCGIVWFVIMFS